LYYEISYANTSDPYLDPDREIPYVYYPSDRFTLGVYKANAPITYDSQCLHYGNGLSDQYLNAGAAEGSARFFGTLAAALGGLSMLAYFGLAATEPKKKIYVMVFEGILCAAAFFQMFIFILMASDHCSEDFWNDFLSVQEQNEVMQAAVSCELGDSGWYAIVALVLYIFAALLVALKRSTPSFSVCAMEWTKDSSGGSSNMPLISDDEEKLVPIPAPPEAAADERKQK
jgi:hypothetical protein